MQNTSTQQKGVYTTLGIFLAVLTVLSSIAYYMILRLNVASIYVGFFMMTPALAAFITLIVQKRSVFSLPWRLKELKYLKLAYVTPLIYVTIAYGLILAFDFGAIFNAERIVKWKNELGLTNANDTVVIAMMVFLLLTVGVVKNLGSTLGEEIGWRGFLIVELRKIMSFKKLSIVSGVIWAVWHYPILYLMYGNSSTLWQHILAFTIMIVGVSVILAYYTFKSNSLWPAAIFHSIHNIYIQKVATPLFITNEKTSFWIDEFGFMIPIVTSIMAIYIWQKASKEQL